MSERLPRIALAVLVVGLAAHNLVMAELWDAGVRGASLDVLAAWKDVLLAVALAVAILGARSLPVGTWADRVALAYAAIVLLYWLVPQGWLDGAATQRGQLFAARHDLIPVAAYFLGRLLVLTPVAWRRLALALVGVAVFVTAWGLIDVYLVPLQWWRDSGVPGCSASSSGSSIVAFRGCRRRGSQHGRPGQPDPPARVDVPSPLATAYLLVRPAVPRRAQARRVTAAAGVAYVGLLWTYTPAAYLALALGLVVWVSRSGVPRHARRRLASSGSASSRPSPTSGRRRATRGQSSDPEGAGPAIRRERRPAARAISTASHLRTCVKASARSCGTLRASASGMRERVANRRRAQGMWSDVHRDRRRHGHRRSCGLPRLAAAVLVLWRRSAWLSAAWVAMLRSGCIHDRRPLDRLRAVRPCGRGDRRRPARRRGSDREDAGRADRPTAWPRS